MINLQTRKTKALTKHTLGVFCVIVAATGYALQIEGWYAFLVAGLSLYGVSAYTQNKKTPPRVLK